MTFECQAERGSAVKVRWATALWCRIHDAPMWEGLACIAAPSVQGGERRAK